MKHPRYSEWLLRIFHPRRDELVEFEASHRDCAELIRDTFLHAGNDLRSIPDEDVSDALWNLASPMGSKYITSVQHHSVPIALRAEIVRAVGVLYRDCFRNRCAETLGNLDEPGALPLNSICYMFWDICPLGRLGMDEDQQEVREAVFGTLSDILRIKHRACVEGGLHGLGELAYHNKRRVQQIIDEFLLETIIDSALSQYASNAGVGHVQ